MGETEKNNLKEEGAAQYKHFLMTKTRSQPLAALLSVVLSDS